MTDVTPQNYIQHAMRTNSDTVGTYNVHPDLIHGALGLADELIELKQALDKCDRTNALEELSDICWFVALASNRISAESFLHTDHLGDLDPMENIEYFVGLFVSDVKRSYAYGKDFNADLLSAHLYCIVDSVAAMAIKLDSSLDQVLQLNINKLSARYPERFTPEQANNRDTERERAVLEQNT